MDKFHLLTFNIEERFGAYYSDMIKCYATAIAHAETEEKFEVAFQAAMTVLKI